MKGYAENIFFSGRKGLALQIALVVLLVGGILVAAIFEFTAVSTTGTTERSMRYGDQMTVAGYAEKAKGAILSEIARVGTAIHPGPFTANVDDWQNSPRPQIDSVSDLQIRFDTAPLNPALSPLVSDDRIERIRRVILEVFDLTYDATQIQSSDILTDPEELRRLPPALDLNSKQRGKGTGTENLGTIIGAVDTEDALDDAEGGELDLSLFGAYLIRTSIYERDANVRVDRPIRVTEEAFFQVLSKDI